MTPEQRTKRLQAAKRRDDDYRRQETERKQRNTQAADKWRERKQ